jgi:hypothetical protein
MQRLRVTDAQGRPLPDDTWPAGTLEVQSIGQQVFLPLILQQ